MEGFELFSEVKRVSAPEDFEACVLARLPGETRARIRRRSNVRIAFAATAAAAVIGGVLLGVFVLPSRSPVMVAGKGGVPAKGLQVVAAGKGAGQTAPVPIVTASLSPQELGSGGYVPMLEKVDYSSEYRNVAHQPKTVFILEQVSEGSPSGVRF